MLDDGSVDNAGNVCDTLAEADDRIIVIHQENKGLLGAHNAGVNIAITDYLCFVDGDDEIVGNYTEKLLEALIDSNVDLAINGITFYEQRQTRYMTRGNEELDLRELSYAEWQEFASIQTLINSDYNRVGKEGAYEWTCQKIKIKK